MLNDLPKKEKSIKNLYSAIVISKRYLYQVTNIFIKNDKVVDSDKIYWIDPKLIKFHTDLKSITSPKIEDRVFNMHKYKGKILDGDWDLSTYKFTELDVYTAFNAVINNNVCWQDTGFYQDKLKTIENGGVLWGCHSKSDFDQRCKVLDALIESIRKKGYLLNSKCYIEGEKKGAKGYFEEITVNIGRDGRYLFQDGRHRLSIALLLGVKKIPIKVLVRHKQYKILHENL
ncbi:MAG: ParB N-terminal domain-containing protein [Candidatus Lokiarchaeia archaeon]